MSDDVVGVVRGVASVAVAGGLGGTMWRLLRVYQRDVTTALQTRLSEQTAALHSCEERMQKMEERLDAERERARTESAVLRSRIDELEAGQRRDHGPHQTGG